MKQKFNILIVLITFVMLTSCDTNDNNDPNTPCDAKFYTMASTHWDSATGTYNIYEYQKSNVLSTPNSLTANQNFPLSLSISFLSLMESTISTNGKVVYHFTETPVLFTYDINTGSITTGQIPTGSGIHPEFLGNSLYFLNVINQTSTGGFLQTGDCVINDEQGNIISQYPNVDFSNSGSFTPDYISNTSDQMDKIFYLANTKLIIYDHSNNTWSDFYLENYDDATNKVIYFGVEYVDANTLYALRGNYTDPNNTELKLVKINLSSGTPQVSPLKDLTGQLSVPVLSIINGNHFVNSTYDPCDDSYYFTYADMGNINSIVFEIKLVSNTINEYPVNNKMLYGFEIYN